MAPRSKVTAQGQISVPAAIRQKLGLSPGSVLEWEETEGNEVIVRRVGKFSSEDIHRAIFPTPPKPRSLAELRAAVGEHLREKHARR